MSRSLRLPISCCQPAATLRCLLSMVACSFRIPFLAITVGILMLLSCMPQLTAQERDGRWAILMVGNSGDPDLQKAYLKEITDLRTALEKSMGFPHEQIVALFEDPALAPGIIEGKSTREELQTACRQMAARVRAEDMVFVFIDGHGTYDGNTYKLNCPGPDPTAEDLASMLYSIPARRFVIVNATSSSGGSIASLSREGTVLIAATKSGMERNSTHLGRYFVDALQNNAADTDKNGRVSMLEAFFYARQRVENYYVSEGSLQTEHPVLDDLGEKKGQDLPGPENGAGLLARTLFLDKEVPQATGTLTIEQQGLAREARDVEQQIEALKYSKSQIPENEYEQRLEALLLRLAQINAKLPK